MKVACIVEQSRKERARWELDQALKDVKRKHDALREILVRSHVASFNDAEGCKTRLELINEINALAAEAMSQPPTNGEKTL